MDWIGRASAWRRQAGSRKIAFLPDGRVGVTRSRQCNSSVQAFTSSSNRTIRALGPRRRIRKRRMRPGPWRLAAAVRRPCRVPTSPSSWPRKELRDLLTFDYYRDFGRQVAELKEQLLA